MRTVVVTGADGFLGRNLIVRLEREDPPLRVLAITRRDTSRSAAGKVVEADVVYHLAGVNRPQRVEEFEEVNVGFTEEVVQHALRGDRRPAIVLASSTQADGASEYGRSKRRAEEILERYATERGGTAILYRLPNVFGKWARPEYNSVVATFCHRLARDRPIDIHDRGAPLRLVHVDDVVEGFRRHIDGRSGRGVERPDVQPLYETTVGELADRLHSFRDIRVTLEVPDMADRFTRLLYATYLSYLPTDDLAYAPPGRADERGTLTELLKSGHFGQVFVSTTRPGVTRGGHYHHAKAEKFCVLRGEAIIRFRRLGDDAVLDVPVSGDRAMVVDIPPGYTHSIENVGEEDMIVLFWASEVFDPGRPDTWPERVEA